VTVDAFSRWLRAALRIESLPVRLSTDAAAGVATAPVPIGLS